MASLEIRNPWTFRGLIEAFFDLALAYSLLCASTLAFFASKFLDIVGLLFPCPCYGVFGYRSVYFCWHRLLIDWPVKKISEVKLSAMSRFPFDSIRVENRQNGVFDSEPEAACSSSFSGRRIRNLGDRENGFDVKGKRVVSPKQKYGIRRRKRTTLGYGKFDSLTSVAPRSPCDCRENGDKFNESPFHLREKEYGQLDEETCDNDTTANHLIEKSPFVGTEADRIKALERALAEERSACSALCLELEKERAAAATAADEAMAMISRLQEDKASMEIETRQYSRMIDEKFAYDEEEIEILKEILIRREKDNHFLEKEVESYRRTSTAGDEDRSIDDESPTCSSRFRGNELIEKTVILVDHVDCTVMLDSVPEDMSDGHDIVDER